MLYNDYRPLNLLDVQGQEHNIQILKKQVLTQKYGQSYLFAGHHGSGKTTVARILARSINCSSPGEQGPCNTCPNCKAMLENRTMDIFELDAATNNGVEQIKELISSTKFLPSSMNYKIYIIDEVHNLSQSAFDALLKTLEEPPEYCIFIFCTTELHKIPSTIRSRCETYTFTAIPNEIIIKRLEFILEDQSIVYEPKALALIAKNSNGALRDAISILQKIITISNGTISAEIVKDKLSLIDEKAVTEIIMNMINDNVSSALNILETILNEGKSLKLLIDNMLAVFSDLIILHATGNSSSIQNTEEEYILLLNQIIKKVSAAKLFWLFQQFTDLREAIRNSINPYKDIELFIIKCSCNKLIANDILSLSLAVEELQNEVERMKSAMSEGIISPSDEGKYRNLGEKEDIHEEENFTEELEEEGGEGHISAKEDNCIQKESTPADPFPDIYELLMS